MAPKYLQPFVDSHIIWATVGSSATDGRLHCGVGDTFGSAKHVALVATYAQAPADSQVLLAILLGKPVTEGQLVMPVGMVPLVVFAPMQLSSAISSAVTLVGGGALALLDSSAHSAAHAAVALHAAICTGHSASAKSSSPNVEHGAVPTADMQLPVVVLKVQHPTMLQDAAVRLWFCLLYTSPSPRD